MNLNPTAKKQRAPRKKKHSAIRDDLGFDGAGIYAVYPFVNLDEHGKGLFKIGMAENLSNRIDHYFNYFPEKLYIVGLLQVTIPPNQTRTNAVKVLKPKSYYIKIEKEIWKYIMDKGAECLFSVGRVINKQIIETDGIKVKGTKGQTEWFYTTQEIIEECFETFKKKYPLFKLWLREPLELKETTPVKNKFVGEIEYNLK